MERPRIKMSHQPIRQGHDQIRIGGIVSGINDAIDDPDGWVWALLHLLDGSRSVKQVVADLQQLFPDTSPHEVWLAIGELAAAGHIEDAAEVAPDGLTESDRERYSRGRALLQWMDRRSRASSWDTQLLLKRAKVVVVGLGGVGGTAALALTVSGLGHVHCIDSDVVELSNLNRQVLYTEQDLGRLKVDATLRRLRERNSDVLVTGERRHVAGVEDLTALAASFDVIVLAADDPQEIRSWTNQACYEVGARWVLGGYHGPLATVGLFQPGSGPCYDCTHAAERERVAGLSPRTMWSPASGAVTPHAANAVTAGVAGHLAAHAVISLLTGVPALPVNRQYVLNLVTLEPTVVGPEAPHPRCSTCGSRS